MKKPYEEVKKLATQGPWKCLDTHKHNRIVVNGAGNHAARFLCGTFNSQTQPEITSEQRDANAALFAHHWNTYEELVEMLKRLRGSIRHSIACKAPHAHPCTCNANQLWEESEKVLAKAQQVEVGE